MKAKLPREPNSVLSFIVYFIVKTILLAVYRFDVKKHRITIEHRPFILLVNHVSNLDFLLVLALLYPTKIHLVATKWMFRMVLLRPLLHLMGMIPKEQFAPDVNTIKTIMRCTNHGMNIELYPSGQSTYTGESTPILLNSARLLQHMNVPVYALRLNGLHIAYPKWNMKSLRSSILGIDFALLYDKDEIRKAELTDIYRLVHKHLYYDDYQWQRTHRAKSKRPRSAEGLERILITCPGCRAEFTIQTKGNRIRCTACGQSRLMDEYGFLLPPKDGSSAFADPLEWYRWQKTYYDELLDDSFTYSESCRLYRINEANRHIYVGAGVYTVTAERFTYRGDMGGQSGALSIDHAIFPVFAHEKQKWFNIYYNGEQYAVCPDNIMAAFKTIMIKEILYQRQIKEFLNKESVTAAV